MARPRRPGPTPGRWTPGSYRRAAAAPEAAGGRPRAAIETVPPAPGIRPEPELGQADARVLGGDDVVGEGRELDPGADGGAVEPDDESSAPAARTRHGERAAEAHPVRGHRVGERAELVEIAAHGERRTVAADDDGAGVRELGGQRLVELVAHADVERVATPRAGEDDLGDAAVVLDADPGTVVAGPGCRWRGPGRRARPRSPARPAAWSRWRTRRPGPPTGRREASAPGAPPRSAASGAPRKRVTASSARSRSSSVRSTAAAAAGGGAPTARVRAGTVRSAARASGSRSPGHSPSRRTSAGVPATGARAATRAAAPPRRTPGSRVTAAPPVPAAPPAPVALLAPAGMPVRPGRVSRRTAAAWPGRPPSAARGS